MSRRLVLINSISVTQAALSDFAVDDLHHNHGSAISDKNTLQAGQCAAVKAQYSLVLPNIFCPLRNCRADLTSACLGEILQHFKWPANDPGEGAAGARDYKLA